MLVWEVELYCKSPKTLHLGIWDGDLLLKWFFLLCQHALLLAAAHQVATGIDPAPMLIIHMTNKTCDDLTCTFKWTYTDIYSNLWESGGQKWTKLNSILYCESVQISKNTAKGEFLVRPFEDSLLSLSGPWVLQKEQLHQACLERTTICAQYFKPVKLVK